MPTDEKTEATIAARLDERTLASIAAYDEHAREYQETLRYARPKADVRRFASKGRRGDLVLDVACGPGSDLRLLRDTGLHPVGVDLSMGALREGRMLLPRHPLVRTPLDDLPFTPGVFGGMWANRAFDHLPRGVWADVFTYLLSFVSHGPIYVSCLRGRADLLEDEDPVLGTVYRSAASEEEIEGLLLSHGVNDVRVELRPDPMYEHKRTSVVAFGVLP